MENMERDWYVVYSKPHKEERAQFHLGLKGLESFFPRLHLPGSAGKKQRTIPLFPNYLFVRIHLPTEYHYVIWSPGVKKIVTFSETPIPLEESIVNFLRQKADANGIIQAHTQLRRGQEVEISGGPFDGLLGIIEDPPDSKGRVKVLLKLLSRQISVKLDLDFIRGEWVALEPLIATNIGSSLSSAAG